MNSHALLSWYTSTTTFLLDCDGVLWRASEGVAGVAETISLLRNEGRRVFFVTNNSTKSRDEYVAKLASVCGISSSPEDIISSAFAAAAYCKTRGFTRAYVVGQRGLADELAAVGVTPIGLTDGSLPFAFGSLRPSDLDPGVQAVVVGFDGEASYYKLNLAAAYLRERPEVAFVATNRDATYPDAHMIVSGGGTLVAAVALGAGREPDAVAGKPSTSLLDIIETTEALDRRATCMVRAQATTSAPCIFMAKCSSCRRLTHVITLNITNSFRRLATGSTRILRLVTRGG